MNAGYDPSSEAISDSQDYSEKEVKFLKFYIEIYSLTFKK